jgi:hypothetical protein
MRLYEITKKRDEKTLYVCRPLLNADDVKKWARKQGFETCVPADTMHVTVIYSKQKVNWDKTEPLKDDIKVEKNKNNPRSLQKFGEKKNVVVLTFYSKELSKRYKEFRDIGCSFDYPEYKAHITITYDGKDIDIAGMEPYEGTLKFGPEIFDEINDAFKENFEEEKLD